MASTHHNFGLKTLWIFEGYSKMVLKEREKDKERDKTLDTTSFEHQFPHQLEMVLVNSQTNHTSPLGNSEPP